MLRRTAFFILFFLFCQATSAQIISVGNGSVLRQGLPIRPVARFSYSQQIYYASEIGLPGEINRLDFQYLVESDLFYPGNKNWDIYLAHTDLEQLDDWLPASQMSLVYSGILSQDYFDSGLPGSGWLNIPLQQNFYYNGSSNLLIAVDENTDACGSTGDDFYCSQSSMDRALVFQSMTQNPDPAAPPAPTFSRAYISNLRLHLGDGNNPDAPQNLYGYYADGAVHLNWQAPASADPEAYIIHRNGSVWAETPALSYSDSAVNLGSTYTYSVQARYAGGLLSPHSNVILIDIPLLDLDTIYYQSFEALEAFGQEIPRCQNLDLDGSLTWAWEHTDFPGEGGAMGWMVFAPALTTPPLTDIAPATGSQMLMSVSATTPPNDDWLILPNLSPGTDGSFSFKARSYTSAYGLERLRVLISSGTADPAAFSPLHSDAWLAVPAGWTQYEYDLSSYSEEDIYLALNCVSLDAFVLFVDDLMVTGKGGELDAPDLVTVFPRPFPNPSHKHFSLKSDNLFELGIYNIRGQRIAKCRDLKDFDSIDLKLSPGIYLLRIRQGEKEKTFRQVVLP